jgi:hypothetical protein
VGIGKKRVTGQNAALISLRMFRMLFRVSTGNGRFVRNDGMKTEGGMAWVVLLVSRPVVYHQPTRVVMNFSWGEF